MFAILQVFFLSFFGVKGHFRTSSAPVFAEQGIYHWAVQAVVSGWHEAGDKPVGMGKGLLYLKPVLPLKTPVKCSRGEGGGKMSMGMKMNDIGGRNP